MQGHEFGRERLLTEMDTLQRQVQDLRNQVTRLEDSNKRLKQEMEEREKAEESLRRSEEQYRNVVENVNVGILVAQNGRLVFANRAISRFLGVTREELVAYPNPFRFIYPDDRSMVLERHMARLSGQDVPEIYPYRVIDREGNARWIEVTGITIDWDGEPGTLNFFFDIEERMRADAALKESEERYRQLAETAKEIIITCNVDGMFTYANGAALEAWGYSWEQLSSMNVSQVLTDHRDLLSMDDRKPHSDGGQSAYIRECNLITGRGTTIPVEMSCSPIVMQQKFLGFLMMARDISERKKMEEECIRREKLESLGIMAGGIAHDFNNILAGILGNLSLARMMMNDPEADERLEEAERATVKAKGLTQQLLTFSRGGDPIVTTTSIEYLLKETATFVMRGSKAGCTFDIPHDVWPVDVDEGQLGQVLSNLLINADQAMPEGGTILLSARNVRENERRQEPSLPKGKYVEIAIQDQGVGIPPEVMKKIFDPFFTTKPSGSGLGLATAYSIIKKHNGDISVASEPGKGTRFTILLPASEGCPQVKPAEESRPVRGSGRILVMDDDGMVRETVSLILDHLGYVPVPARGGEEAIRLFGQYRDEGRPFDALIMDLTIPGGMGGKEAVKHILEIDPDAVALVSSGYFNDPVMSNPAQYGFKGVIAKPFKPQQLGVALQKVLGKK